jgi:hypothetical protein
MVGEQLQGIFKNAQAKADKDGFLSLPEGTHATVYAAHGGVALNIARVEGLRIEGSILTARTAKRESYMLEVGDVFAVSLEGASGSGPVRRAGFG